MRQLARVAPTDAPLFVFELPPDADGIVRPRSKQLQRMQAAVFSPDVLHAIDERFLAADNSHRNVTTVEKMLLAPPTPLALMFMDRANEAAYEADYASWVNTFCILAARFQDRGLNLSATALWTRIVARTDAIYVATEDLLPAFKAALIKLMSIFGTEDDVNLNVAQLKGPMRVHEKARPATLS
eukprot:5010151-Prymnesium_polylepis.1